MMDKKYYLNPETGLVAQMSPKAARHFPYLREVDDSKPRLRPLLVVEDDVDFDEFPAEEPEDYKDAPDYEDEALVTPDLGEKE